MKRVFLTRHAKSSWAEVTLKDFDRLLNKRGEEDAPFMGRRLRKYRVLPDLIISSPAARAHRTTEIIAGEIGYPLEKIVYAEAIYGQGSAELLKLLQGVSASSASVMLVGHNPDLTELAEILSNRQVGNIPTCGIFCLDFEIDSWQYLAAGSGSLVFFDYPKKHKSRR